MTRANFTTNFTITAVIIIAIEAIFNLIIIKPRGYNS